MEPLAASEDATAECVRLAAALTKAEAERAAQAERIERQSLLLNNAVIAATEAQAERDALRNLLDEVFMSGTEHVVPGRYAVMQIGLHLLAAIAASREPKP